MKKFFKVTSILLGTIILVFFLNPDLRQETRAAYSVPPPQPAGSSFFVGSYYMPKQTSMAVWWLMIAKYNQWHPDKKRIPLLGFYDQSNPEVLDWQIKWALEHGVSYWVFDEFWEQGQGPRLKTMEAFFASRYHERIKFAVMLTGFGVREGASLAEAEEELLKIADYWIINYFNQPNYLRIEGKPYVVIYAPKRVLERLGDNPERKMKEVLEKMSAKVKKAGLGEGIYWVTADEYDTNRSQEELFRSHIAIGFKAIAPYGCTGHRNFETGKGKPKISYDEFFNNCLNNNNYTLNTIRNVGRLKFVPAFAPAFDATPRGEEGHNQMLDYDINKFEEMLKEIKEFVSKSEYRNYLLQFEGKPMIGSQAWNEWPEDSELEPGKSELAGNQPFAILDLIRKIFTNAPAQHSHDTPPRYDVPWEKIDSWEFDNQADANRWAIRSGSTEPKVENGIAKLRINKNLQMLGATKLESGQYTQVKMRLKAGCASPPCIKASRLGWRSSKYYYDETGSEGFDFIDDGGVHEYTITVAGKERWEGIIEEFGLYIRPKVFPTYLEIDYVRVEKGFSLSPGWNQITWPDVSGYTAKSALENIDSDCGAGTAVAIARKRKDWWEDYVAGFGGKNFTLNAGNSYHINVTRECRWNP